MKTETQDTIRIVNAGTYKSKPDQAALGFGKYFTDYMFQMEYVEGKDWHEARIVPYAPLTIDPAAMVFHYGQAIFEGMKAFRAKDGRVLLFRPEKNAERFNLSCSRLSIPSIDENRFLEAVKAIVNLEKDWIPEVPGSSLYIRPFVIATEAMLGVRPSTRYLFSIILSPVGSYYSGGLKPVSIRVEDEYVRSVRGGTGFAKVAGNYAASLKAQVIAQENNCDQVLWLDGVEQKYIEEVGSMNVFFKVGGEVWTPALNGSILGGVTRDSVIQVLHKLNIPVVERRISIEEIADAHANGTLEEAFGTGTAAVISPIGRLNWQGQDYLINNQEIGTVSKQIYDTITGIQYGELEDTFGWTVTC